MTISRQTLCASPEHADRWPSKSQTLARVAPRLRRSRVPLSLIVSFGEWCQSHGQVLNRIRSQFGNESIAIRSSAIDEDDSAGENAGRYLTRLNVASDDAATVSTVMEAVFHSYGAAQISDEVLIQPMQRARVCVVAATHTLDDLAPYYSLSFAVDAKVDAVTRGNCAATTVYFARGADIAELDDDCHRVVTALVELESIFPDEPIEAEMLLNDEEVILLQVRPIRSCGERVEAPAMPNATNTKTLDVLHASVRSRPKLDGIVGTRRLYGQMPDWNPAELIGSHPRPLAFSLFRRLISRENWRTSRAQFGYRKLPASDLIIDVAGRPYVDVRSSFNSFLPQGIDEEFAACLVDVWSERLHSHLHLHDKVEFEVATTCVDFDFDARYATDYANTFAKRELASYRDALLIPTRECFARGRLKSSFVKLQELRPSSRSDYQRSPADWLSAAERAAFEFAKIARQAFVAEALLRSAVRRDAMNPDRLQQLRQSIDLQSESADNDASSAAFNSDDASLRPGTFEVAVPTYAERGFSRVARDEVSPKEFVATSREIAALDTLCAEAKLGIDGEELLGLYRASHRAREGGKHMLSIFVSRLLDSIRAWGERRELDRSVLTWLSLDDVLAQLDSTRSINAALCELAEIAREKYENERLLKLPVLFEASEKFHVVTCPPGFPTFQGRGVIHARVVEVTPHTRPELLAANRIVAIENADPGFDWIFDRAPAALITAFGGPNSHMAIRCAGASCPAVLGCGVEMFRRILRHRRAIIDFDSATIESSNA